LALTRAKDYELFTQPSIFAEKKLDTFCAKNKKMSYTPPYRHGQAQYQQPRYNPNIPPGWNNHQQQQINGSGIVLEFVSICCNIN
jgi:hypothetical protein